MATAATARSRFSSCDVPKSIDPDRSTSAHVSSSRSAIRSRTCGIVVRAVTAQSIRRTSSPTWYSRASASSVPGPGSRPRCSPCRIALETPYDGQLEPSERSVRERAARSSSQRGASGAVGHGQRNSGGRCRRAVAPDRLRRRDGGQDPLDHGPRVDVVRDRVEGEDEPVAPSRRARPSGRRSAARSPGRGSAPAPGRPRSGPSVARGLTPSSMIGSRSGRWKSAGVRVAITRRTTYSATRLWTKTCSADRCSSMIVSGLEHLPRLAAGRRSSGGGSRTPRARAGAVRRP